MKKHLVLIYCLVVIASCKLRISPNGTTVDEKLKTFSIDQFTNQATLGPSTIGFTFTEKLRDLFQSQTKLELVSDGGDLNYDGTISSYTIKPIAIQSDGNQSASQNRLTISVKINFVNQLDPTKNFDQNFTRFADYSSNSDIATVENDLIEEIFNQLTQDIFDKTLGDW